MQTTGIEFSQATFMKAIEENNLFKNVNAQLHEEIERLRERRELDAEKMETLQMENERLHKIIDGLQDQITDLGTLVAAAEE